MKGLGDPGDPDYPWRPGAPSVVASTGLPSGVGAVWHSTHVVECDSKLVLISELSGGGGRRLRLALAWCPSRDEKNGPGKTRDSGPSKWHTSCEADQAGLERETILLHLEALRD